MVGAAKTMLYQLVLWPLTLCMMLVSSAYRFILRVGCHGSPLRFRNPPRWLVRLISKPCRLINPPVAFGVDNLKDCVGGAGVVEAAAGHYGGHDSGGGITGGVTAEGGGSGGAATITAAGAPTAAAATGIVPYPPRPVLLVGNQGVLGLDSLAVLNEVCMHGMCDVIAVLLCRGVLFLFPVCFRTQQQQRSSSQPRTRHHNR